MDEAFVFADELGPAKILHIYNPAIDLKAIVVVDNVAIGPAIGGIRVVVDGGAAEAFRLARAMTLKNAAAGLRHGGAKSIICSEPLTSSDRKECIIRGFAQAIRDLKEYIPGPDMGTDETCMAWINDEIGRAVGLPREIGGIPLDEIGATGWGLCNAIEVALAHMNLPLAGARVVVQGFGAVGAHAARFLEAKGAVLVGACDIQGAIYNSRGLDVARLTALREAGGTMQEYEDAERLERDAVIDMECDIWIPAARPDVVNEGNVHRLRTRLVAQGANIPFTEQAEEYLHRKGVLVLPDIIANAGGVICAAMEYRGETENEAFGEIQARIRGNTGSMLQEAEREGLPPRQTAVAMAKRRVLKAMGYQRFADRGAAGPSERLDQDSKRSRPCIASGFTAGAAKG